MPKSAKGRESEIKIFSLERRVNSCFKDNVVLKLRLVEIKERISELNFHCQCLVKSYFVLKKLKKNEFQISLIKLDKIYVLIELKVGREDIHTLNKSFVHFPFLTINKSQSLSIKPEGTR